MVARMAERPIVFALANPDPEVHPTVAHKYAAVVATGLQLVLTSPLIVAAERYETQASAPSAPGLLDRRVELVSPVTRSMTQHAMESNASTWLADLEDATSPTWFNMIEGQIVLADAVRAAGDGELGDTTTYASMKGGMSGGTIASAMQQADDIADDPARRKIAGDMGERFKAFLGLVRENAKSAPEGFGGYAETGGLVARTRSGNTNALARLAFPARQDPEDENHVGHAACEVVELAPENQHSACNRHRDQANSASDRTVDRRLDLLKRAFPGKRAAAGGEGWFDEKKSGPGQA